MNLTNIAVLVIYPDGSTEYQLINPEYKTHGKYLYELWKNSKILQEIIPNYELNHEEYMDFLNEVVARNIIILLNNAIQEEYVSWINMGIVFHYRIYTPVHFSGAEQTLLCEKIANNNNVGFLVHQKVSKNFKSCPLKIMQKHIEDEKQRLNIDNLKTSR